VRVFNPSGSDKNEAPGQVYVTDLNQVLKAGKAPAKVLSREAFETAALAQLPPGESSALAAHGAGAAPAEPPPSRLRPTRPPGRPVPGARPS